MGVAMKRSNMLLWFFALAVPVAIFFWLSEITPPDAELGGLVFLVVGLMASYLAFLGLGTIALIRSSPQSGWGKLVRRAGLGVFGLVGTGLGLEMLVFVWQEPDAVLLFGIVVLVALPLGLLALYELVADLFSQDAATE
jgi:hypothetical protein